MKAPEQDQSLDDVLAGMARAASRSRTDGCHYEFDPVKAFERGRFEPGCYMTALYLRDPRNDDRDIVTILEATSCWELIETASRAFRDLIQKNLIRASKDHLSGKDVGPDLLSQIVRGYLLLATKGDQEVF